jgi:outer membrane lipoprotein SlyB
MKRALISIALILATAPAFGQNISANIYDSRAALSAETAEIATVVAVRPVLIKNTGSNTGTYLGATVGSVTGYALTAHSSNYASRALGSVVGGVVGGAVGQGAFNSTGPHRAVQVFVQRYMPNGRPYPQLTGVVEADDQGGFQPGQRVLLVRGRNGLSIEALANQAVQP